MKVQKTTMKPELRYPSRRQLSECTALLGAAAIGLGSLAGMATPPVPPVSPDGNAPKEAEAPPIALGGVMVVEPPPPRIAGGIRPEPPPPGTNAMARTTYVVQKGDTLSSIARSQLGNSERMCEIAKANPGIKPDDIKPGQILVLPPPPPPPQIRGGPRMPSESNGPKP